VFSALSAVIRADGVVTSEEREALLEATKAAGANEEQVARAIDGAVPPMSEWTAALGLTFDERVFVYAAGLWLAGVDGTVTTDETDSVQKLGEALQLEEKDRVRAGLTASSFGSAERNVLGLARAITRQALTTDES